MTLKELKKGALFTLKPFTGEPKESLIWVKGEYDRASKTYNVYKWEDTNHESNRKASLTVYEV